MNLYKLDKLKRVSLAIGYVLVFSLLIVCLMPNPPDTSAISFGDKIAHLLGYTLLFLWFAQIFRRNVQIKLAFALIALGIFVEVAQSFTGYRSFEYADMLANTSGVIIGWVLAATPLASLLFEIEKRFMTKDY